MRFSFASSTAVLEGSRRTDFESFFGLARNAGWIVAVMCAPPSCRLSCYGRSAPQQWPSEGGTPSGQPARRRRYGLERCCVPRLGELHENNGLGIWLVLAVCAAPLIASGQARPLPGPDVQQIYQRLLPQIEKIPIFDHHAHPGFADDPDVDAMASPPGSAALRTRDTNPELVAASKALFGYPYNDLSPEHAKWLVQKKAELKKEQGNAYFSNLLDKLNIEQGVANRAMMADYLDPKRFPWVFFADSFMWPLDNQRERARNRDEEVYMPLQEKMLHRWMQQENVRKVAARSSPGIWRSSAAVLEDNQKKGGIAMKFEVAYFRSTKFGDPTREQAEDVYQRFVSGGIPSEQEYRTFQDYIFRFLVREGGRLHLPVHVHSAVGIGDYFNLSESNIMNLENILRDPRYSSTVFVMIHGGYPYEHQAIWLAAMQNVSWIRP